jgi:hypothetical protein
MPCRTTVSQADPTAAVPRCPATPTRLLHMTALSVGDALTRNHRYERDGADERADS